MKSPRHKPRGISDADLMVDHALRKAIRTALRELYPGLTRLSGHGWVIAPAPALCPDCDGYLFQVRVPDVAEVVLGYCVECDVPFIFDFTKDDMQEPALSH